MIRFVFTTAQRAALALAALVVASPAVAQEDAAPDTSVFTAEERLEIRRLVRETLLNNPEILEEMVVALEAERIAAEEAETRRLVALAQDELLNDPRDFVVGPADAKVTIVEFFDYNCSFCKVAAAWVTDVLERHPGEIRVVFKEAPIFADELESSGLAARAALAAVDQDKYLDVHFALMEARGSLEVDQVRGIVEGAGARWRPIEQRLEDPELGRQLEDNLNLASRIGMRGTPFFVINGEPVFGAQTDVLDALVAEGLNEAS